MTATALPSGLSWEQFLELLDQGDEYKNAELIDGQVVVSTPSRLHQRVVVQLLRLIGNWVAADAGRGEVTFNPRVQIAHNRGYLPDVAWYSSASLGADDARSDGPPDFAVEVLSPSTRAYDVVRKRADYARIGVRELWLVDPGVPTATVLRRKGEELVVVDDLTAEGVLSSPLMPDLAIRLGDLVR